MPLFKKLIAMAALLAVVCVLAVAALIFFVDPNKMKPVLIAEIQKQTGYQAVIDGKLGWSIYPRVGVTVERMTLAAPRETKPFLILRDVNIAAKLSQLWQKTDFLEGSVRIGAVSLMQVQATDVRMNVNWKDQIVTLNPLSFDIYQGTCKGLVSGGALAAQPVWSWKLNCSQVALNPLLHAMSDGQSRINISGEGQLQFEGKTQGKSSDQLLRKLNGLSTFSVSKGVVDGIDLNYFIQAANALLTKQPVPLPTAENNKTTFDTLTGTMVIKNGVASIDNLLLVSAAFATKGAGSVDLPTQKIDYELEVTPLAVQKIRWMIPVQITGDLHSPSIHLDTLKLNTLLANEEFEKVKHKVQQEIKKLPAKADKLIKHLLGS